VQGDHISALATVDCVVLRKAAEVTTTTDTV
jgi:hypothetical protein